jgi:hypothetical protein
MALWNDNQPPVLYPDAVATPAGWADPITGELLVTVSGLSTYKGGAAELVKVGLFTGKEEFEHSQDLGLPVVYSAGEYMVVEAVFSEPVTWTGDAPQIVGTLNGNSRTFAYFQDLTDTKAHTADKVMSVLINSAGTHYQVGDVVTFAVGGGHTGSSAQGVVTSVDGSGGITGVQMVSNGAGYDVAPTAAVSTGHVVGVTVGGTGTAYVNGDTLVFTGGGGTGAAGYIVVNPFTGNVERAVVTNPGTGFTSVPTVAKHNLYGSGNTFTAVTSYGSGASLTAVLGTPANGKGTNRILFRYQIASNETATSSQITFTTPVGSSGVTTWTDVDSTEATAAAATAVTASGVTSYTVSNGGSGYTSAPVVHVAGDGTGATAVAVLDKGINTAVPVVAGAGYRTAPTVTLSGDVGNSDGAVTAVLASSGKVVDVTIGGTADTTVVNGAAVTPTGGAGSGFAATVVVVGGDITGITVTNMGSGYTSAPTLAVAGMTNRTLTAVIGKAVASYTVTAGTGFLVAPTLTVAAPTATSGSVTGVTVTRATATATLKNLQTVNSVTPVTDGSGYTAATVTFSGGGGTNAAATATVTGEVDHVNVTNPGSGYWLAPTVSFSGGGGTGAAATAIVDRGQVIGVTVTNNGIGYTSAPTVAFTPTVETPTLTFDNTQYVSGVSISGTGSDYEQGTALVFSTGVAAGSIIVDRTGNITGAVITNGGSYASAPTLTVAAPPAWSSAVTYPANSVVLYSGTRYRSKLGGNLNQTPGVATTYWLALADQTLTAIMGSSIVGNASVDGVAPTITGVSIAVDRFGDSSTQSIFATGDWFTVAFTCSKPVFVTPRQSVGNNYHGLRNPYVDITMDSGTVRCYYFSGSGSNNLRFSYQFIATDHCTANNFAVVSPITLSWHELGILDAAGNELAYTFTPPTTTALTVN